MKKWIILLIFVIGVTFIYTPTGVKADAFEVDSNISEAVTSKRSYNAIVIYNCMKGTEIKNLMISNTNVCAFDKKSGDNNTPVEFISDINTVYIHILKKGYGVSYVTGDIYWHGTKIKSFKTKVNFYKYTNPFKKIKLGKKNLKKKFKKKQSATYITKNGKKYKFSIKLKKGWKIDELKFDNGKKNKTIKNNKKIKIRSVNNFPNIFISLKNKKQKSYEEYWLYLY